MVKKRRPELALFLYVPGHEWTFHGMHQTADEARSKAADLVRMKDYSGATEAWVVRVVDRGNKLITMTWHDV